MRVPLALGILAASVLWAAQPPQTVTQTVELVRNSLRIKHKDNQIAGSLRKWRLSESLDEHTIEELQSEGAGPKTIAELERLRLESQDLPKPATSPQFDSPSVPAATEQEQIANAAREIALNYSDSLPDFIATESVRRYDDTHGFWSLRDRLTIKLSYYDKAENYKVQSVNGHPSLLPYESVGGVITQGEFGSLLREIFEARSKAELHWDHWTHLRGRPAHVFSFRVLAANSHYQMTFGNGSTRHSVTPGQHGFVYVDRETSQIVRIVAEADSIPRNFPVRHSATSLDYGFADVGGKQFLLPLRAEVRMGTETLQTRNEVEFQDYRKFTAETTISFGDEVPVKPAKE